MTISNGNSFNLFSYGLESVFCYFQFQWLISGFPDNPLKLHITSCRGSRTEKYVFYFQIKYQFIRLWGMRTTFIKDILRKKPKNKNRSKTIKK